jgi:hypothetical protein
MIALPVTHGPPITRCGTKRMLAPCRSVIRLCTGTFIGDGWSASLRFITCKKCRKLGQRGKFELVFWWREQTKFRWREQLGLGGVA